MRTASSSWTLLLAVLLASSLEAGQVRSVGLEEMTQRADRIFSGRCIATEVVRDPQLGFDVTQATFEVDRAIKGDVGRTVTVKVFGASGATGGSGREGFDAARFERGERVVLFLYADSALGLTSPVGLGQGKFSIFKDKQGHDLAINAFGNRNLRGSVSMDGGSDLSAEALLDGARDLLAIEETPPRDAAGRKAVKGARR